MQHQLEVIHSLFPKTLALLRNKAETFVLLISLLLPKTVAISFFLPKCVYPLTQMAWLGFHFYFNLFEGLTVEIEILTGFNLTEEKHLDDAGIIKLAL